MGCHRGGGPSSTVGGPLAAPVGYKASASLSPPACSKTRKCTTRHTVRHRGRWSPSPRSAAAPEYASTGYTPCGNRTLGDTRSPKTYTRGPPPAPAARHRRSSAPHNTSLACPPRPRFGRAFGPLCPPAPPAAQGTQGGQGGQEPGRRLKSTRARLTIRSVTQNCWRSAARAERLRGSRRQHALSSGSAPTQTRTHAPPTTRSAFVWFDSAAPRAAKTYLLGGVRAATLHG